MEQQKKISFGFKKTKKFDKPANDVKKDFIDCLEGQSIKIIGEEIVQEKQALVIPMKPNTLMTGVDRLKQIAQEVESSIEGNNEKPVENHSENPKPSGQETLDQMVVRELLEEAKNEKKSDTSALVLPIPTQPVLHGEKESSLEDYESIPIAEFGLAMLRGMGWKADKESNKHKAPELRPKGLGLGADKAMKQAQNKSAAKEEDKELMLVKNACVKIIMGKYTGYYGKVVSLDEDTGRVTVDIAIKKETVSINECVVQPVTKAEYEQQSRVLNADKYEEHKTSGKQKAKNSELVKSSDRQGSSTHDREKDSRDSSRKREKHKHHQRKRSPKRKDTDNKRDSSNDSLSSTDGNNEQKRSFKSRESRRRSAESESSDSVEVKRKKSKRKSSTPDGKRDIDKKRKGKKKKRDRDRSPNYKKYRK